jgi:hypothetical protein
MYYQYFLLLPGEVYYATVFLDRVSSTRSRFAKFFVIAVIALVYATSIIVL